MENSSLRKVQEAKMLYKKIVAMSSSFLLDDGVEQIESFKKEAKLLLNGVLGSDSLIGIFDHRNYYPILEVGEKEFWGNLPEVLKEERMAQIMSLLERTYLPFFTDSVKWLISVLEKIPYDQRENIQIFHCGIRYRLPSGKPICLFSKSTPIHYDENRKFNYSINYVQNINHLLKKDFPYYWIRISYGADNQYVQTFHSQGKLHLNKDLLSIREKEILKLVADDFDTKEIAKRLFISIATVGNHRSNMIEKMGARDSTAMMQLAKMGDII